MGNKVSLATKLEQKVHGAKAGSCCIKGPLTVCGPVCWDYLRCIEVKRLRNMEKKANEN